MITLTDYCTTDSIRAVLGVSTEEIEDATILAPIYAVQLQEKLADINPGIVAAFAALPGSPSADQLRFKELVQSCAAYQVAQFLLTSVRMFAPQTVMDSKSQMSRVTDPYADLRGEILGTLDYLIPRVRSVYTILFPTASVATSVARIFAINSGIAFDPVTGV
jgi:hypothetical protein